MTKKGDQIADLLRQTGHAHHQAFIETDGEDPEWPTWYADYLFDRLPSVLGTVFTREQLATLLSELDQKQKSEAPEADWPGYYGEKLVSRYSTDA